MTALNAARGNITRAAARLGIHRNTMRYRLTKHELIPREATPLPAPSGERALTRRRLLNTGPANTIRWEERPVAVLGVTVPTSQKSTSASAGR